MDCSRLKQLESCANELARAANSLAEFCQTPEAEPSNGFPNIPPGAPSQAHRARRVIMTSMAKLQNLISDPSYLIQQLASQNQLLACLQWLGEFQVLACIPLQGSVLRKDIAELAGVPEALLARVIRMTSTAGFLCEPQPLHVAHTPLSADFVTKPCFLDAAMLVAGSVAPAALQMATATRRWGESVRTDQSPFNLAAQTPQSFQMACEQSPKLRRQWAAYQRAAADADDGVADVLGRSDWGRLASACIIEDGSLPPCTVDRIAQRHPHLNITLQLTGEDKDRTNLAGGGAMSFSQMKQSTRFNVQRRGAGQLQTVRDAGVYVLCMGSPSPMESSISLASRLAAELHAHLPILRDNRASTLVVVMRLLPDPGSVDAGVEAVARMRDLALLQLANERDLETGEVVDLVSRVGDWTGKLVVVHQALARNNAVVALAVKFQAGAGASAEPFS